MGIQHTLWMFDMAGRDDAYKTRDQVKKIIDAIYLANCNDGIDNAFSKWIAYGETIAPNRFDAVVFVIDDTRHSLVRKIGGDVSDADQSPTVLGTTALGATGGGLAEVYWDRCVNHYEVAGAIFHEAAHLKSDMGKEMHDWKSPAQSGGMALRILSAKGGTYQYPSWGDLTFYEAAVKRAITLRTKAP